MRLPARAARAALVAALLAAAATGCGSASEPSPPTGVDGLTVPTPDPDPGDFVARVDNRWLPLAPGASWTYEGPDPGRVTVVAGTVHDGIATTVRLSTPGGTGGPGDPDGAGATADHVAQDRAGNVWWLGRQAPGEERPRWFAEPGLLMPAEPRRGDGFVMAPELDVRAQVVEVGARVDAPAGRYDDVVVLEVVEGSSVRREYYAPGLGLVRTDEAGLVAYDEPR